VKRRTFWLAVIYLVYLVAVLALYIVVLWRMGL